MSRHCDGHYVEVECDCARNGDNMDGPEWREATLDLAWWAYRIGRLTLTDIDIVERLANLYEHMDAARIAATEHRACQRDAYKALRRALGEPG